MEKLTSETITPAQIEALMAEAVGRGDDAMVEKCEMALDHYQDALEDCARAINSASAMAAATESPPFIDVVFDGPPGHDAPRFVEVENPDGASVKVGEWLQRDDGYWALRIPMVQETKID